MPRFSDEWVIDRTLFDYVSGGSCACCGFPHLFLPDGISGLIHSISDFETDAADAEVNAIENSPWPVEMRNDVWMDRVRLRHYMKKDMAQYAAFWNDDNDDDKQEGKSREESVKEWCVKELGPQRLRRIFQMSRKEITERIKTKYNILSSYGIVICTVVEQVANFKVTGYPIDGRGSEEIEFEKLLTFDRRGGFMLPVATRRREQGDSQEEEWVMNDDVWNAWINMMKSLGGPKLLHRGPKRRITAATSDEEEEDDEVGEDGDEEEEEGGADDAKGGRGKAANRQKTGPSFRADRRIVRLLIARYWADQIIAKFNEAHPQKKREVEEKQYEEGHGQESGI